MGRRGRNNLSNEHLFFITTTVHTFTPVFFDHNCCNLLIENIKHYQQKYRFSILGYVIMPTHFHWIIFNEHKVGAITDIMRDIKKYAAWEIMKYLRESNSVLYKNFLVPIKPGQKRQFWMHRFDDEVIRNDKMFWQKLKYIHNNPVKSGLTLKAEDYLFSSARNYLCNDDSTLYVDTDFVGTEMVNFIM